MQLRILPIALLACLPMPSVSLSEPIDPAQAIAQKFYEADQPAPKPVAKKDDRPGHDYEEDMLRRARDEEADWQKQNTRDDIAVQPSAPVATVQPAFIQPKAAPDAATVVAPRLIETIAATKPMVATPVAVTPQERADEAALPKLNEARATVLIVLDDDDYGWRRIKPDPIICFDQQCWISNGLEAPAKPMPRSQAVALKTTDTPTGDSCSGKSGCAFRDIAFNPTTRVQVIEVGDSRGVSDGAYTITTDASCQKRDGGLACDNAVVTHAFRMWVVPEATAQAIGAIALENAVADGLPDNGDNDPLAGK